MKAVKIIRTIFDIIILLLAVFCISIFLFVKINGMEVLVVKSGSMEPTINVDDVVVIQPVTMPEVKVDDIITYVDNDIYVTHRVVEILDDGQKLKMKGDNNNTTDKVYVTDKNLKGLYVTHFSNAADTLYFLQSPYGIITLVGVPLLIYMILSLIIYIKTPEDKKVKVEDKAYVEGNKGLDFEEVKDESKVNNVDDKI